MVAAALLLAATIGLSSEGQSSPGYQGLFFTLPSGWTTSTQQGRFVVAPSAMPTGAAVFIVLYGRESLTGSFDDWLGRKMTADLGSNLRVLQSAPPTRARAGSLDVLSGGRTVQDQRGAVLLQIYYAVTDGKQAGLAMVATTAEAALKTLMPDVQALFQSLRFAAATDNAAKPAPASAPPAGTEKRTIAAADLVGDWSHASAAHTQYSTSSGGNAGSTTVAYGDGYRFKADGTFTYSFTGMMNSVYIKESDSGTWGFEGGNLVIRGKQRSAKTYQIVGYEVGPDRSVVLTLLDTYYPRTQDNIGLYAQRYVRQVK